MVGLSEYPLSVTIIYLALTEAVSIVHHGEIISNKQLKFFQFTDLFAATLDKTERQKKVKEFIKDATEKEENADTKG